MVQQLEAPARAQHTRQAFHDVLEALQCASDESIDDIKTNVADITGMNAAPQQLVQCQLHMHDNSVRVVLTVDDDHVHTQWGVRPARAAAIVGALRFVRSKVDEVTIDVVKYRLEMLQNVLHAGGNGIEYARRYVGVCCELGNTPHPTYTLYT